MNADRFDTLTKRVVQRRNALQLLAGGTLMGALAVGSQDQAEARCPRSRRCGKGTCCPRGERCANPDTQVCVVPTASNPDPICAGTPSCCSTRKCGRGCICQTTIEGGGFCYRKGKTACGETCTASSDCEDGVCVVYAPDPNCEFSCCAGQTAACVPNSSRC